MLLSRQLPLSSLIEFCRILRHNLSAGLTLRHVLRQQAERGSLPVRPVATRISQEIEEGESLEDALNREKAHFPPMFVSLVTVGEQSGTLPDVLGELEKYFLMQQKLRRDFVMQIAWPMLQFFAAPFVLALMIFFLAILSTGDKPFDPLGLGYVGVTGAIKLLVHFFGTIALLVALYLILTRSLRQKAAVDEILLRIPALGSCLSAVALSRFCLALRMTMDTGMSIAASIRLSMRATGNAAFAARGEAVVEGIKEGDDLTQSLGRAGLFPYDFLQIMANAEEGGRVPEIMRHQAEHYTDEARRRLTILSRVTAVLVYLFVAGCLLFMIGRIFLSIYGRGGLYDKFMP